MKAVKITLDRETFNLVNVKIVSTDSKPNRTLFDSMMADDFEEERMKEGQ